MSRVLATVATGCLVLLVLMSMGYATVVMSVVLSAARTMDTILHTSINEE